MLSDRERQTLDEIEDGLRESYPHLAATLANWRAVPPALQKKLNWFTWALIIATILAIELAVLTNLT